MASGHHSLHYNYVIQEHHTFRSHYRVLDKQFWHLLNFISAVGFGFPSYSTVLLYFQNYPLLKGIQLGLKKEFYDTVLKKTYCFTF